MKRKTCMGVALLALGGCSPLNALTGGPAQMTNGDVLRVLGEHMDGCYRRYQGGLGVGASFTFAIECDARPPAVVETPEAVSAPAEGNS